MECTQDLHHQQQLEQQEQEEIAKKFIVKQLFPAYCDYIAHRIKEALNQYDERDILVGAGAIRFDLDGNGSFVSTKKTLTVVDKNGKQYRVTVEEA
jgi:hypothetical protein